MTQLAFPMVDANPASRPYVLWFKTLPSGDEAKLFIYPQQHDANVVLHWNGTFHSMQTLATRDLAEQRGWAHGEFVLGKLKSLTSP